MVGRVIDPTPVGRAMPALILPQYQTMIRKIIITLLTVACLPAAAVAVLGFANLGKGHASFYNSGKICLFAGEGKLQAFEVLSSHGLQDLEINLWIGKGRFVLQHSHIVTDGPTRRESNWTWRDHGLEFGSRPPNRLMCDMVSEGERRRAQFPSTYFIITLPCWIPLALLATYPLIALIKGPLRRRYRRKRNRCIHCGYNLTANTTNRCPECGQTFSWDASAQL